MLHPPRARVRQIFFLIQVTEMFLRDGEGVKRSDESRFPALLNRKVVPQSARNGEFPVCNRKHPTEEKQIAGIGGLYVSTQRCRRCWQNQPELANTRTRTTSYPLLPFGACMCSSINADVFAVHHGCRLQIEQGIHDFRDLNQPRNGLEFFERFVVVVGVHRSVNNARRDCVRPNTVSQEFHRQCAVKRRNGGLGEHGQRNRRASQRLIRQNRRDAHDMAGLLFAHLRDHLFG